MNARGLAIFLLGILLISSSVFSQQDNVVKKSHSPTKATLFSTFLPGAGQVYNRQIWKVPVIYVMGAATTYVAVSNYQNSIKFKNEYFNRINGNTSSLLSDYSSYSDESILALHQAYNKNFQLGIILTGAVYLLNIVDAMVFGHLFDFNISDDLSAHITPFALPSPQFAYPNLGMTLSIRMK